MGDSSWALESGSWGSWVAIAYQGAQLRDHRICAQAAPVVVVHPDHQLFAHGRLCFLAGAERRPSGVWWRVGPLPSTLGPHYFFWWAYKWAGHTLHLFYPADFSWDSALIRFEESCLGRPPLGLVTAPWQGTHRASPFLLRNLPPLHPGPGNLPVCTR